MAHIVRLHHRLSSKFLAIVILLMVIPQAFIYYTVTAASSEVITDNLKNNLKEKSFLVGASIDLFFDQRLRDVRVISQADVLETDNARKIINYLTEVVAETPYLNDIDVYNAEGVVIASSGEKNEMGQHIGATYPELATLFNSVQTAQQGDVFISKVIILDDGAGLAFLTPITDDTNTVVIKTLLIEINLDTVKKIVADFDDSVIGDKYVYLVDNDGRVIVTADPKVGLLDPYPDLVVNPALLNNFSDQGDVGSVVYTDKTGVEVMAGFADMTEFGINQAMDWSIIAVAPLDAITAPIDELNNDLRNNMIGVLVVTITFIFLLGRGIINAVNKLVASSKLITAGDVDHRMDSKGETEFSYLADTFNETLDGLTKAKKQADVANNALRQSFKDLEDLNSILGLHSIVSKTDPAGLITYANDKFSDISGYSNEELIGNNHRILNSGHHTKEFFTDIWQAIANGNSWQGEICNRSKNGNEYWVLTTIAPVFDGSGNIVEYTAIRTDITDIKYHQSALQRTAHYDLLTNLPNRVLLADRLIQAMAGSQRHQQSLAVVFLDLDGFKAVNDSYGHEMGDKLLVELSTRMKEALREDDTLSRFGGDEFVAILPGLAKVSDSEPVLERLLEATAAPVTVGDVVMQVSASMGITLYPQDGSNAEQLIRHADQSMYVAKQAGKNCYHFFDTAHEKAVTTHQETLSSIRLALKRQEFVLYYQPKVNMGTGDVIGVEALIRWQHPDRGLVPPLDFLPAIEGNAISLEIGEWVIDTALTQISQWQSTAIQLPISVNISAYQLQQDDFATRLAELLAAHPEVNPLHLELEVLETSALSDFNTVAETMEACHELGVRFALDDFGTGYSSLTYIRRLPAYLIKIDQSFVRDMLEDADDLAIIEGVIALAKSFKREVIAEGVETVEHGAELLKLGCELAQGYGIARPMPANDIPEWMNDWKPDISWRAE